MPTLTTANILRAALAEVVDPEIPTVSILDMGMVGEIEIDATGLVAVEILPTFSGCPALSVIAENVRARLAREPGVRDIQVRFVFDPIWTSDRITDQGRARLREFGIAPAPLTRGLSLPMIQRQTVTCPFCGSSNTVMENLFGPTPCRSIYRCVECRNPFERFKAL
ncbi:MAG TPA: 1,2-phenylacetyl-CoA epoxidase subunit PaaD [Chloroflexota bacterium]|nr:1,2-phenylacetyl-CoA epoxidase subunit PaaD [Chloroflexota bacterium]